MAAIDDAYTELSAIAALCCEATGEERGTRSALECAREALALARRYDARELLRCNRCGEWMCVTGKNVFVGRVVPVRSGNAPKPPARPGKPKP
jgi:hypothetical protein